MILIPEIETVVILTPRTGSGSLRRAIADRHPKSMLVYRHMEADGVPIGYDHWRRVGVVRHPVERLWSLYKFLRTFDGDHDPAYIAAMRASVEAPFNEWIVSNQVTFTSPYDRAGLGRFFPAYTVRHPMPENFKSQWHYLRPDLGTTVYRFDEQHRLRDLLDLPRGGDRHNTTNSLSPPALNVAAMDHVCRFFRWDLDQTVENAHG